MNFDNANFQKIYLTGFAEKRVEDLPDLLTILEAVLIDIRFKPPLLPLGWSENYLRLLLKKRYLHVSPLGFRSFREGKPGIQNIQLGINLIKSLKVNVLLFCECREYDKCHRRIIAEEFMAQGYLTREIESWKKDLETF